MGVPPGEICGKRSQKTRKFTSVNKFNDSDLKKAFDKDVKSGSLCASCDRAVRKSILSENGVQKVSYLMADSLPFPKVFLVSTYRVGLDYLSNF